MKPILITLFIAFAAFAIAVVLGIFLMDWPQQTVLISAAISAFVSASIMLIKQT